MAIQIRVRDGRIGRDPNKVDMNGFGEVLATFESDQPYDEGDILTLADGTEVKVIGLTENLAPDAWTQDLAVGEVFEVDKQPPTS